jgi:hypothetical protein
MLTLVVLGGLHWLRHQVGRRNITNKTLIDDRFLG